jgi:hypothetical protein
MVTEGIPREIGMFEFVEDLERRGTSPKCRVAAIAR